MCCDPAGILSLFRPSPTSNFNAGLFYAKTPKYYSFCSLNHCELILFPLETGTKARRQTDIWSCVLFKSKPCVCFLLHQALNSDKIIEKRPTGSLKSRQKALKQLQWQTQLQTTIVTHSSIRHLMTERHLSKCFHSEIRGWDLELGWLFVCLFVFFYGRNYSVF